MYIIGYSCFKFKDKNNLEHEKSCLRFILGEDYKHDDDKTRFGYYRVEIGNIVDYSVDNVKLIHKYYTDKINVEPLYNKWGKIYELREVSKVK